MLLSVQSGIALSALIDVAFLATLAAVAAREIVAGRNWRNLRVLAVLGLLIAGNIVFHAEVYAYGKADYGIRIGIGAVILLISVVGRARRAELHAKLAGAAGNGPLPAPFSRFDAVTIAVSAVSLATGIGLPDHVITGSLLTSPRRCNAFGSRPLAGDRTTSDRLVLILHVGYAFVPIGFALLGTSIVYPSFVPASAGTHAWTAGAFGMMTLAVMTRASLGHTGQPLAAGPAHRRSTCFAFCAAMLRIVAAFNGSIVMIELASMAWVGALAASRCYMGRNWPLVSRRLGRRG